MTQRYIHFILLTMDIILPNLLLRY